MTLSLIRSRIWAVTIGVTVIGLGMFIVVRDRPRHFAAAAQISRSEAKAYASASLRVPNYTFYRGSFTARRSDASSNSFRDIKQALRNGSWWSNPESRRFLLSFAAGMLCVFVDWASLCVSSHPRDEGPRRSGPAIRDTTIDMVAFGRHRNGVI